MAEDDLRRLARIRPNLERRDRIISLVRAFFHDRGFLEVETPVRAPAIAPERHITPFTSEGWFLVTSPELYMKRLLAAGYGRLFQVSRCFRKGERGRRHNPEFTLLEWYRTGADCSAVISDTEALLVAVAAGLGLSGRLGYRGQAIDLTPPWPRVTVREAFRQAAGWDPVAHPDPLRFDIDLVDRVVPRFAADRPTVLAEYPAEMCSLARLKPGNPSVAERAEVFIAGLELANAYSELIDPAEQAKRFRDETAQIRAEKGLDMPEPALFLEALPGMPECGGIALGLDRLAMLFCDTDRIDDVMAFTADNA
ncbi:MAG: EF-P lysine aminoacylase GenX [Chloroflexi bacterium]|nr:EF-P lysine aminoacylase GenX [Chloroflexota bacterium]